MKGTNVELVDVENATYGSDICFPGDQIISLENGDKKLVDNSFQITKAASDQIRIVQETLDSIKEVILYANQK